MLSGTYISYTNCIKLQKKIICWFIIRSFCKFCRFLQACRISFESPESPYQIMQNLESFADFILEKENKLIWAETNINALSFSPILVFNKQWLWYQKKILCVLYYSFPQNYFYLKLFYLKFDTKGWYFTSMYVTYIVRVTSVRVKLLGLFLQKCSAPF